MNNPEQLRPQQHTPEISAAGKQRLWSVGMGVRNLANAVPQPPEANQYAVQQEQYASPSPDVIEYTQKQEALRQLYQAEAERQRQQLAASPAIKSQKPQVPPQPVASQPSEIHQQKIYRQQQRIDVPEQVQAQETFIASDAETPDFTVEQARAQVNGSFDAQGSNILTSEDVQPRSGYIEGLQDA